MHYIEVAPIKIVRKNADAFTYASTTALAAGTIVTVPVGKKTLVGVVLQSVTQPSFDCREIDSVVEETPLPAALLATASWMAQYYQTHLSVVLSSLLPSGITKKRQARAHQTHTPIRTITKRTPTASQQAAIDTIMDSSQATQLLFGVTGSGKTLVYIECAKKLFNQGISSVILVPEIALTSQIVDEFRHTFGDDVLVTHSHQTEAERHIVWQKALRATTPKIVIGPRSALFLPLQNLGLIVLDEFHEPSYKQEQQPRYSSLRVATILARQHKHARAVFGSATPPIAEYYLASKTKAPIISLPTTAKAAQKPSIALVDMKKRAHFTQHRFLSDVALKHIDETLETGKQVMLFHNRRGTTATTLCEACGWTAVDPDTDLPLTLHADKHQLVGHVTGFTMRVPTSCPQCGEVHIVHKGIGTKLIESELRKRYPNKNIVRFDGDMTGENSVDKRYDDLYSGAIDIIIGTQVIAKGIDLPHLRTVCVVQADAGLALPDYTASERTFQLLAQAVGRVGRSEAPTTIIVQSYQPEHPAVAHGVEQQYAAFYETALAQRKASHFPPFTYLARFTCTYKTEATAIKQSRALLRVLKQAASRDVLFFGPAPAFYEKQHGTYRWNIIAKSPTRQHLAELSQHLPPTYWQFELDPISLL